MGFGGPAAAAAGPGWGAAPTMPFGGGGTPGGAQGFVTPPGSAAGAMRHGFGGVVESLGAGEANRFQNEKLRKKLLASRKAGVLKSGKSPNKNPLKKSRADDVGAAGTDLFGAKGLGSLGGDSDDDDESSGEQARREERERYMDERKMAHTELLNMRRQQEELKRQMDLQAATFRTAHYQEMEEQRARMQEEFVRASGGAGAVEGGTVPVAEAERKVEEEKQKVKEEAERRFAEEMVKVEEEKRLLREEAQYATAAAAEAAARAQAARDAAEDPTQHFDATVMEDGTTLHYGENGGAGDAYAGKGGSRIPGMFTSLGASPRAEGGQRVATEGVAFLNNKVVEDILEKGNIWMEVYKGRVMMNKGLKDFDEMQCKREVLVKIGRTESDTKEALGRTGPGSPNYQVYIEGMPLLNIPPEYLGDYPPLKEAQMTHLTEQNFEGWALTLPLSVLIETVTRIPELTKTWTEFQKSGSVFDAVLRTYNIVFKSRYSRMHMVPGVAICIEMAIEQRYLARWANMPSPSRAGSAASSSTDGPKEKTSSSKKKMNAKMTSNAAELAGSD
jgi:hypothetical protein